MIALYIALVSVWFAELTNIPQTVKWIIGRKTLKPFDCPLCLSFWLQLIYEYFNNGNYYLAPLTSITAVLISMILNKIR